VTVEEGARVAQARASEDAEPGRREQREDHLLEAAFASCPGGIEGKELETERKVGLTVAVPSCAPYFPPAAAG
jgi:hypothetical protein